MDDKQFKYMVQRFDQMDKRIDGLQEKVEERNDAVFNRMDSVYKEVIDIRDEQAGHQMQHQDIKEHLDVIEAIPVIAHEIKK